MSAPRALGFRSRMQLADVLPDADAAFVPA
jgi:hypothetical protein